ncbi:hypothetical protein ABAC460_11375 [Asticcacaulis sp. AC460]|uniref:DUF1963 domain-containing protein n=1 Tax=Asticcacaulis sp. AC460 TaxID=1282360 RepID=UPI0003C3F99A|nr:DUF1963 domain-containing protein [Asticcacaulis sp. AC460]ESQ89895.1 hypothetical protein ABAC460_11375 [Asticcacaulis sp. AC460]
MKAILNAIGTFIVVLYAIVAGTAVFTDDRVSPSQPGLMAIALLIAAAAAGTHWWIWGRIPSPAPIPIPVPTAPETSPAFTDRLTRVATPTGGTPVHRPPQRLTATKEIRAGGRNAIVFRQHFPPHTGAGALSFFGGVPLASKHFSWPQASSKPLTFLMQIDCAAIPATGHRNLLPHSGVLYVFLDLAWEHHDHFRIVYEPGPTTGWAPVIPPPALDLAYGKHAPYVWEWTQSAGECPQTLPRWPFEPVVIDLPPHVPDPEAPDAPILWPDDKAVADELRRAQGDDVLSEPFSVKDLVVTSGLNRPFANYPQDWRAVQIACGLILERLKPHRLPSTAALRDLSQAERDTKIESLREATQAWRNYAEGQSPFWAVPGDPAAAFFAFLSEHSWLTYAIITQALTLSVEASLTAGPEAAARIPPETARRVHGRHALASTSTYGFHAVTPDRILAPPCDVQGNQYARAQTHLLLLELSSNDGIAHFFGEGVYQFWITPEDLKARRFDRVELTADAY